MSRHAVSSCALLAALFCLLTAAPAVAETVKARVLDVQERRNEVRVDVAGQSRTYSVDNRALYRILRRGRLVVITAEFVRGRHTIVRAEAAAQEGRVLRSDERRGSVTIRDSESGATETYYLDRDVRPMRAGDLVSFDIEERGRESVITRWRPIGGRGGGSNILRDAGLVRDVDQRRSQVTIELASSNRRQTFQVPDRRLLDRLRRGDRVSFEYERQFGGWIITSVGGIPR